MVGNNMNGEINWIVCACVNAWCVWIQCIRMVCVCYYCHKNRVGWSTISNAVRCVLYSFQFFFSFIYIFCFLYFDSCRPVIRFCLNCILFYFISLHYYHHRMHRWHICCCFLDCGFPCLSFSHILVSSFLVYPYQFFII